MSSASLFGVYTARFPYLETDKDKIRPVIVVSRPHSKHNIILVAPVSSMAELESADIAIKNWREAGLVKPSVARVHRLTSLLQSDLTSHLGGLSVADKKNLQRALRELLNL